MVAVRAWQWLILRASAVDSSLSLDTCLALVICQPLLGSFPSTYTQCLPFMLAVFCSHEVCSATQLDLQLNTLPNSFLEAIKNVKIYLFFLVVRINIFINDETTLPKGPPLPVHFLSNACSSEADVFR